MQVFWLPGDGTRHAAARLMGIVAEQGLEGPALGLLWSCPGDGPGVGPWDGERLVIDGGACRRVADLRPLPTPAGAGRADDARQLTFGALCEAFGWAGPAQAWSLGTPAERCAVRVGGGASASGLGGLMAVVATLAGLGGAPPAAVHTASALGQAAARAFGGPTMAGPRPVSPYPFPLGPGKPAIADWVPLLHAAYEDRRAGVAPDHIALRFCLALAGLAAAIAQRAGAERVVLAGTAFRSRPLAGLVRARLAEDGRQVLGADRPPDPPVPASRAGSPPGGRMAGRGRLAAVAPGA